MCDTDLEKELARRKSAVRVRVTYAATGYALLGALVLIIGAVASGDINTGKDIFLAVLPVATGVITYWFADRSRGKKPNDQ